MKDKEANHRPVWKKRGAERWLYLTTDKNWGVGGQREFEEDFNCKNSSLAGRKGVETPLRSRNPVGI